MWNNQILSSQSRIALLIDRLASSPPNSLLLEGGTRSERKELALYWAMSLNCRTNPGPCGKCPPCIQIQNHEFRDMFHMEEGQKVKIEEI
ncbi:MAG: DNA polymerase III subunit delta', partial [Desulfonatronovibrio sp.]